MFENDVIAYVVFSYFYRVNYRGIPEKDHTSILLFSIDDLYLVCVSAKLPEWTVAPFHPDAGTVLVSPIVLAVKSLIQVGL